MPLQEKSPVPVAETYQPPLGVRYPVKTGESWISIARVRGIDPWDLIEFNFPGLKKVKDVDLQRATRYVNWYLSEYVGCRTPAPDGQNWAFSSGLTKGKGVWKGGVIYLPPAAPPPPPPPAPEPVPPPKKVIPPPCEMRRPDFYRLLNPKEQTLARAVFGPTLPAWERIGIGNGLGDGGRPWTSDGFLISGVGYPLTPDVRYAINVGNVASVDLTSTEPTYGWLCDDFGRVCDSFIHEMTHVWQMYNQSSTVMIRSAWAQEFGAGYDYTPGDSWDSYNVEQQAHIVEDWHKIQESIPHARGRPVSVCSARDSVRQAGLPPGADSCRVEEGFGIAQGEGPGLGETVARPPENPAFGNGASCRPSQILQENRNEPISEAPRRRRQFHAGLRHHRYRQDLSHRYLSSSQAPVRLISTVAPRLAGGFRSLMDQNIAVVNANGGNLNQTVVQAPLQYGPNDPFVRVDPNITASAYTNNFAGICRAQGRDGFEEKQKSLHLERCCGPYQRPATSRRFARAVRSRPWWKPRTWVSTC